MPILFNENNNTFHLYNDYMSYIIGIERNDYLVNRYFGTKLESYNAVNELQFIDRGFATNPYENEKSFTLNTLPLETSTNGSLDFRISNYQIRNDEGYSITDFKYNSFNISSNKKFSNELPSLDDSNSETLEISLLDEVQNLEIILSYTIYENSSIITRNSRYINNGIKSVFLENAGSMCIDFPRSDFELITLDGSHTNEANINREILRPGIFTVDSNRGVSSPQHQPYLCLVDPSTTEFSGEAFAFHLIYSGDFQAQVEVEQYGSTRVQMGLNSKTFEWKLNKGETFQTPEVVINYTNKGLNDLAQSFHYIYQNKLIPEYWRNKTRPILLNSWEGNYFDFDEKKILKQATFAKNLGIELFVLDDGWFGHRNATDSSLGDWYVDKNKIPNGIGNLSNKLKEIGIDFGIWFEPEMISTDSELYKNHPEWCFHVPNYKPTQSRQQLVLNLSIKEVQDFLINTITDFIKNNNISYIKWDMNRHLTDVANFELSTEQQKEVGHRYVLGLYRILQHVTTSYPEVLFENCSSGGGRFDPGMMAYMPQTWASDNSDAICRSKIQYGYSMLYPPIMMGSHISDCPNHQVGRITPLETRFLIAMSGNFGYELSLENQNDENIKLIKEQIKFYKKHRKLIQFGEFYRLHYDDNRKSIAWLFKDKDEALLIYSHGLAVPSQPIQYLKLKYLDENKFYIDSEKNKIYSGSELNNAGILIPRIKGDFKGFYKYFKIK